MTDQPYPFQHLIPRRNFLSVPTRDAAPPRTRDGMLNATRAPQTLQLGQIWDGFTSYVKERTEEVAPPMVTPFTPPNILNSERSGASIDPGAIWTGVERAGAAALRAIKMASAQTAADESTFPGAMSNVTVALAEFEDSVARWLAIRDRGHHQEARDASAAAVKGMNAIETLNRNNKAFWARSRDELVAARADRHKQTLQEMSERDGALLSGAPQSAEMSDAQRQFLKSRSSPAPRGNFSVAPSPAEIDAANKRFWKR